MKLQLKRSNVLVEGSAKSPEASQLDYGELAINYSNTDPVLFIKDSTDAIVRIAGAGSFGDFDGDYNSLTNKPTIGDGSITFSQGGTEVGSITVNQVGNTTIDFSAGAIYTAEAGKGISINASNEISIGDDWSNIPALPEA